MSENDKDMTIIGDVEFPKEWTIFGPYEGARLPISEEQLTSIPGELTIDGKTIAAQRFAHTRNQLEFKAIHGEPPYKTAKSAFIFVPLESESEQDVTIGVGADWFYEIWLNGETILDLMDEGNGSGRPAINNHLVTARLKPGTNVLVVRLVNGKGGPLLALGGPNELRKGDFKSILPPPDNELDHAGLSERYPPEPDAPFSWIVPEGFDPRVPGLGMTELKEAEHVELLHCLRSECSADEGGTGVYESLKHGTWNHNNSVFVFKDRLLGVWHNHAQDENGPGSRVLAKVGKVVNGDGDVDWGGDETLMEIAPAAVPVRRRHLKSDEDAVRDAQTSGEFRMVGDRLVFFGSMSALHGMTTRVPRGIPYGEVLNPEEYAFERVPSIPNLSFAVFNLGCRFFQEWGVRDDRFQPLSPIYMENEMASELRVTTELTLPLEPLIPPYSDAPLLADAPADFQQLVRGAENVKSPWALPYEPAERHLTRDGTNGLAHGSQYQRPDGTWVAVRENQKPRVQPFFYGAEKPDAESNYPPAIRSNLYGAVNPASGRLPDGRVYLVANSPNRQNMFITTSKDGRLFDKTWFLLHQRLSDYTPGAMKTQGGPGAGPQYFKPAVIGNSLWLVYSVSKEHVGATRVPVAALK